MNTIKQTASAHASECRIIQFPDAAKRAILKAQSEEAELELFRAEFSVRLRGVNELLSKLHNRRARLPRPVSQKRSLQRVK